MAETKERQKKDIAETFEFVRFIVKHPRMLGQIKNGSEVRFVPAAACRLARTSRASKKVQLFSVETIFHRL